MTYDADTFPVTLQNPNNQILYNTDGSINTISTHWQDWFFQWAFAATATTIPAGAVAERFNFNAYLGYSFFISAWVYPIVVHWAWSQYGWLGYGRWQLNHLFGSGYIDFAGSGVVHMVGGFSGMWACILVGPRMGRFDSNGKPVDMPGHSATLVVLGTVLLWFGWYGFNPGSMIFINNAGYAMVVGRAAVCTTLAGAAGGLMALAVAFLRNKAWDLLACCNGVLCGFVAVTGGCHVLEPWAAIICGAVAAVIFEAVCVLFLRLKIDDPLMAAPMHGFCGAWGIFWVGLMANQEYILQAYGGSHTGAEPTSPPYNVYDPSGLNPVNYPFGLFYYGGGGVLLASQIVGILVIFAWVTVNMVPFFYIFKMMGALRISAEEEQAGLDASKHGGSAYNYDGGLNKPEKASRLYGGPTPGTVGATFSSAPEHGL
jgi:Amt family ammonium transporter